MRVLVTGGAGFIGHAVVAECRQRGDEVLVVDVQPPVAPHPGVQYHELRLPSAELSHLVGSFAPDLCVHCAGRASVAASVEDPWTDFLGSVDGTFAILEGLRLSAPACRLVLLSSAAVYGDPRTLPIDETAPLCPISPYGFHKAAAELLCREYTVVYGIQTVVLRIFSAYGPGLRRQVMWDIARKLFQNDTVELFGLGNETRDFVHVTDIARGALHLAEHGVLDGSAYNIASGQAITIANLADVLRRRLRPAARVVFSGIRSPGDPVQWEANVRKLQATGFQWEVPWTDGLDAYADWVEQVCG
jgi:UDP-glucose 4-epimerase